MKVFLAWCNSEGMTNLTMAKYKGEDSVPKLVWTEAAGAEGKALALVADDYPMQLKMMKGHRLSTHG